MVHHSSQQLNPLSLSKVMYFYCLLFIYFLKGFYCLLFLFPNTVDWDQNHLKVTDKITPNPPTERDGKFLRLISKVFQYFLHFISDVHEFVKLFMSDHFESHGHQIGSRPWN